MQNAALARQFDLIAAYLELAGDSIFKIRAYRAAAEAIADYPAPIEDADLNVIEGLGAATIAKSREWFKTGKIKVLEQLKKEYPSGLLEVLRVPGLGPKKVQLLWKEKDIDSIAKLQEALDKGELDTLNGFGPKTRDNLKIALRRLGELTSRTPLPDATGQATKILLFMQEKLPGAKIEIAGSLRRGVDTVGNINFVASAEDAAPLLDAFATFSGFETIVSRDENRIVGRFHDAVEAELVVSKPEKFGSTLWFHTGSRAHVEKGVEGDFASEADLYRSLGVATIPPELREGNGEWELARENRLPHLVTERDIRGDLHTHSTWSDGSATIRQMAEAMIARGYAYFAVCDHSKALAMTNGLDAFRVREQAHEIAEVQADFPNLKIFRGIECDILRDGTMDLDDELLSELDFVVGSVHSAFNLPLKEQTDRIIRAIQNPHVDLIGHPTGRVLGVRPAYDVDVPALIEAARHTGCCLEINASERLDLKDDYARATHEAGVLLCIDTDAHSPRMLPNISFGVATARRAGCEAKHILNARSLDELLDWMRKR